MKTGIQIYENAATKTATIDIDGYIGINWYSENDNSKERLKKELKAIGNIKADTIVVNINSLGGDVNHGLSIHDLLAEHPAKIITKINGMTASAATIIALAGEERKMSDNALALIHLSSTGMWGNVNDFRAAIADMEVINERIANMYAKAGNKDLEYFKDLMNENGGRGKWIDADEMLEAGLITEKFEPKKMAAAVDFAAYNLPKPSEDQLLRLLPENEITGSIWQKIADRIKDLLAPEPEEEELELLTNQNQQVMEDAIFTQEQYDQGIADAIAAREAEINTKIDQLQSKIDELQAIVDKKPVEQHTGGNTTDEHQETNPETDDYMNIDIHEKVRRFAKKV